MTRRISLFIFTFLLALIAVNGSSVRANADDYYIHALVNDKTNSETYISVGLDIAPPAPNSQLQQVTYTVTRDNAVYVVTVAPSNVTIGNASGAPSDADHPQPAHAEARIPFALSTVVIDDEFTVCVEFEYVNQTVELTCQDFILSDTFISPDDPDGLAWPGM